MADSRRRTEGFRRVPMSEARARLPELTTFVATGRQEVVELCRRDTPTALLISHDRFAGLVGALLDEGSPDQQCRQVLAHLVIERWLGASPSHLRESQMAELEPLSAESLFALSSADPDHPNLEALVKAGLERKAVDRLQKRRQVARVIREAEDEGLYEMAEHATSGVDLEDTVDAELSEAQA